mmetsp:Transcript_24885/g.67202  ORF Transcript_24885/g.67202 Transcript_24885/m.67202 type:complete len:243 (-) Transcript_24885:20-748(-)
MLRCQSMRPSMRNSRSWSRARLRCSTGLSTPDMCLRRAGWRRWRISFKTRALDVAPVCTARASLCCQWAAPTCPATTPSTFTARCARTFSIPSPHVQPASTGPTLGLLSLTSSCSTDLTSSLLNLRTTTLRKSTVSRLIRRARTIGAHRSVRRGKEKGLLHRTRARNGGRGRSRAPSLARANAPPLTYASPLTHHPKAPSTQRLSPNGMVLWCMRCGVGCGAVWCGVVWCGAGWRFELTSSP